MSKVNLLISLQNSPLSFSINVGISPSISSLRSETWESLMMLFFTLLPLKCHQVLLILPPEYIPNPPISLHLHCYHPVHTHLTPGPDVSSSFLTHLSVSGFVVLRWYLFPIHSVQSFKTKIGPYLSASWLSLPHTIPHKPAHLRNLQACPLSWE